MAGQRLVDGVVDDLVDHVVQAGAVVGIADIHARPLAHGIEAAQHLDRIGVVAVAVRPAIRIGGRQAGGQRPGTERRGGVAVGHMALSGWRATVSAPASTATKVARPRRASNRAASVPVIQAWAPSPSISSNRAARRPRSRWAAISSSNSSGGRAALDGLQPGGGQDQRDQQRLLLAGRAGRRRHAGRNTARNSSGSEAHGEIDPVRPGQRPAGFGIRRARSLELRLEGVLPPPAKARRPPSIAPHRRPPRTAPDPGPGRPKTPFGASRGQPRHEIGARRGNGNALLRHRRFQRVQPGRIGAGIPEQPFLFAHGSLVSRQMRGVARQEAGDQPVQEAAPRAGRSAEQARPSPASAQTTAPRADSSPCPFAGTPSMRTTRRSAPRSTPARLGRRCRPRCRRRDRGRCRPGAAPPAYRPWR